MRLQSAPLPPGRRSVRREGRNWPLGVAGSGREHREYTDAAAPTQGGESPVALWQTLLLVCTSKVAASNPANNCDAIVDIARYTCAPMRMCQPQSRGSGSDCAGDIDADRPPDSAF